jgi:hypothetical protein
MENKAENPTIISLTDIQLHSNESNNPQSFERKIKKSIKSQKPERCNAGQFKFNEDGTMEFSIPAPKELKGKKIVFAIPKEGLFVYAGKDLVEKIKSLNKKK